MPNRDDLVSTARGWLGVPWLHRGRTDGGIDCVGLLVVCARSLGVEVQDRTDYSREPSPGSLLSHLSSYLTRAPGNQIVPGRIGVFAQNRYPCHVGIFSEAHGVPHLIHAYARRRKVVEEPLAASDLRLIGSYDITALLQE